MTGILDNPLLVCDEDGPLKEACSKIFPDWGKGDDGNTSASCFIVPILPYINGDCGLLGMNAAVNKRKDGDYCTPVIFATVMPCYEAARRYCRLRTKKRAEYRDNTQAFLCAELVLDEKNENEFINLVTFEDLIEMSGGQKKKRLEELEEFYDKFSRDESCQVLLEKFYNSFVYFYKTDDEIRKSLGNIIECKCNEYLRDVDILLECADAVRMELNGIKIKDNNPHNVKKEMFLSPVPFMFWDFVRTRKKVRDCLGEKKLYLLLVDNKPGDKKKALDDMLRNEEIFNIKVMVKDGNGNVRVVENCDESDNDPPCSNSDYSDDDVSKAFSKIRDESPHFILLDFFLDGTDTYFAFDFIKKFNEEKQRGNDSSTTWYFITSAVHDSVTRYAQSGLLAEYYESAVVNAGDDPTNDKRKIIFLYKLFTFIMARINNISRHHKYVQDRFFRSREEQECKECRRCATTGSRKAEGRCFALSQQAIKRFLAEDENFASLVIERYNESRNLLEILDDTLTKFTILPQADWQLVQHQIDFINSRLRQSGRFFSCSFITTEMKERSETY